MDPGLVVALVVIAVTIASVLVYAGVGGALGRWRERVTGLDATRQEGTVDETVREEVRQMVHAANARRVRRGEEPLDVDAEVERRLRALEDIG